MVGDLPSIQLREATGTRIVMNQRKMVTFEVGTFEPGSGRQRVATGRRLRQPVVPSPSVECEPRTRRQESAVMCSPIDRDGPYASRLNPCNKAAVAAFAAYNPAM